MRCARVVAVGLPVDKMDLDIPRLVLDGIQVVGAFVVGLGYGYVEHAFGPLDLTAYLGQIGNLERGSVLFDDFHERDVVEVELAIFGAKFVLRKLKCLVDEVVVLVFHVPVLGFEVLSVIAADGAADVGGVARIGLSR